MFRIYFENCLMEFRFLDFLNILKKVNKGRILSNDNILSIDGNLVKEYTSNGIKYHIIKSFFIDDVELDLDTKWYEILQIKQISFRKITHIAKWENFFYKNNRDIFLYKMMYFFFKFMKVYIIINNTKIYIKDIYDLNYMNKKIRYLYGGEEREEEI